MRGDLLRVLPSFISINNQKVRVIHNALDHACSRCRYLGHISSNTEACGAFNDDPNVVTIKSPKTYISKAKHSNLMNMLSSGSSALM